MFKFKKYTSPSAPVTRSKRPGVMARVIEAIKPQPKTVELRNPTLLQLARGMPCQLRILNVCNNDRATVVSCHSNWSDHGKAGARKADDCYTVWGCAACHRWLDQGNASGRLKRDVFMFALKYRMRMAWKQIASDDVHWNDRERAAAQWALDNTIGIVLGYR